MHVAAGSLNHRILVLAGEPVRMDVFYEGAGARRPDVKRAVRELVQAGKLETAGAGRGRTYQRS